MFMEKGHFMGEALKTWWKESMKILLIKQRKGSH